MLKKTLTALALFLVFLIVVAASLCLPRRSFAEADRSAHGLSATKAEHPSGVATGPTGTLQRMIVESGTATMELDLNRLNGITAGIPNFETWRFEAGADSFFSILVFNDILRGPEQGLVRLVPAGPSVSQATRLPLQLSASVKQLAIEKLPSGEPFDLAVCDAKTGFVFFNIQGHQYNYDANAQLFSITGGRLLVSKEFAKILARPSEAGSEAGIISIGATTQPIEVAQLVGGELKLVSMPPLRSATGAQVPEQIQGPDVIVGDLPNLEQLGSAGTQVGLAVATTSCNNGTQPLNWFSLPDTDHPVISQNLYRMSGGGDNTERFEQIGQSWLKHAFAALEDDACALGCNTNNCSQGIQLCPGCSDPYSAGLNGSQTQIGSRAWVNPFTGDFPSNANEHGGHNHDGVSHRILVEVNDLNTTMNQGATYFVEAQYVTPHEYTSCQAHPGQCNMFNNASYRKYLVSGTTNFSFSPDGETMRMQSAIRAWTGAIVNRLEPDPGNDGLWFMGYKVTNPSPGLWHYEYALYNQNLDRAIQSFSVPLSAGANISNVGFHAPPQHPGWANDGTLNNQGYSSTPWASAQTADSLTWNCETFATNQNANAIQWGTLYNFRFDTDQPPQAANATVDFFKTGSPMTVAIQAPGGGTSPTPTPTSTATPTATPRPTPTPRNSPIPRTRPTPPPRPMPPR